ncbi:response regulator [Lewinella sp. IMCC34191]|uniref:response regulator n=1 Tax=Lewinella sp. IMCC34191 TaxID=2259172 RepID=UPI001300B395|nr:response regulator [Lewinella sp. IMCC34191]
MLIDDSETDNFIHSRRLKKMGLSDQIVIRMDGRQGLAYLTETDANGRPDLLFLDINMPVMDGWEFLDEYQQLPADKRAQVTVVMLTSSVGDTDYARAHAYTIIDGHEAKPLTEDKITNLVNLHFSA